SWTFPPTTRFACPALYLSNPSSGSQEGESRYVFVVLDQDKGIIPTKTQRNGDTQGGGGKIVWRFRDKGVDSLEVGDSKQVYNIDRSIFGIEGLTPAASNTTTTSLNDVEQQNQALQAQPQSLVLVVYTNVGKQENKVGLRNIDMEIVSEDQTSKPKSQKTNVDVGREQTLWYQITKISDIQKSARSKLMLDKSSSVLGNVSRKNNSLSSKSNPGDGDGYLVTVVTKFQESSDAVTASSSSDSGSGEVYKVSFYLVKTSATPSPSTKFLYEMYLPVEAQPSTFAFNANTATLYTIESANNSLVGYDCEKEFAKQDVNVVAITKSSLCLNNFNVRSFGYLSNISMYEVSKTHMLIIGHQKRQQQQSSASKNGRSPKFVAILWDVEFGVVLSESEIAISQELLDIAGQENAIVSCDVGILGRDGDDDDSVQCLVTIGITSTTSSGSNADDQNGVDSPKKSLLTKKERRKSGKKSKNDDVTGGGIISNVRSGSGSGNSSNHTQQLTWNCSVMLVNVYVPQTTLIQAMGLMEITSKYIRQPSSTVAATTDQQLISVDHNDTPFGYQIIVNQMLDKRNVANIESIIEETRRNARKVESKYIQKFADKEITPDGPEFVKVFLEYISSNSLGGDNSSPVPSTNMIKTIVCDRCFKLNDQQQQPLANKNSTKGGDLLWFSKVLEILFKKQFISNMVVASSYSSSVPSPPPPHHHHQQQDGSSGGGVGILPNLWKIGGLQALPLITLAIEQVTDIPESDMVDVLSSVLEFDGIIVSSSPAPPTITNNNNNNNNGPGQIQKVDDALRFISRLIEIPVNESLIRHALTTRLNSDKAQTLALILLGWLSKLAKTETPKFIVQAIDRSVGGEPLHSVTTATTGAGEETFDQFKLVTASVENKRGDDERILLPALESVLGFISLLLDGHMSMWILTPACHPMIRALNKILNQIKRDAKVMETMRPALEPFYQNWKIKKNVQRQRKLEEVNKLMGLDEVMTSEGLTQLEEARKKDDGKMVAGSSGYHHHHTTARYWESMQQLDKYRVEIVHWK
ncbi:hypothetical protein H4219_006161, partial [Mycoemilia scoparia]